MDREFAELFKGSARVNVNSVHQTSDQGYIIAGEIIDSSKGILDIYIIKTDPNGDVH